MKIFTKSLFFIFCLLYISRAQAQRLFAISGNYKIVTVNLPEGNPEKDKPLFKNQVSADAMIVACEGIPAGKLVIELTFMETEYKKADQRGMAIFANGLLLTANLDVFKEAGGAFKPLVKRYDYDFEGDRININLNGIGVNAILNGVKVYDSTGKLLGTGDALSMKKDRILMKDNRTRPIKPVSISETPFYNVDHSPLGAYSTFVYGMEASGGMQMSAARSGEGDGILPHKGVMIATKNGSKVRVMPFCSEPQSLTGDAAYIKANEVKHDLSAGVDAWQIGAGVSWKHYMPYWPLKEIDKASEKEKAQFALPATWMVFELDNTKGTEPLQVLFGLQNSKTSIQNWGGFKGYVIDEYSALAIKNEDGELVNSTEVKNQFGLQGAAACFLFNVPKGEKKKVNVVVAHFRGDSFSDIGGEPLSFYFTQYYKNIADVVHKAAATTPEAIASCEKLDMLFNHSPENEYRKFQIAHSLQSYRWNTVLYQTNLTHKPIWAVLEGEYSCINTFDLTVDHVFHELALHPWTVRNELDMFDKYYSFTDTLRYPGSDKRYPGGLGFAHDMGGGLSFKKGSGIYKVPMTQEELQNWILCAGLYYKKTNDITWLRSKRQLLYKCLLSMQVRDDIDSTKRDGITSLLSCIGKNDRDITTYDAMDKSLQQVNNSLYISVKSFSCYLFMRELFKTLGDKATADICEKTARLTANSIVSYWNPGKKYFPAVFNDPSIDSKIMPAIEGLIFPYMMGLRNEVSLTGPYQNLISNLKTHMETIMKPGICINQTGGFLLSNTSKTTWESKVFLEQYIAENVLGIKMPVETARADAIQAAYELLGAPTVGWSDQIRVKNGTAYGGRHYPRGVTSALWWLYSAEGNQVN